ncbi:FAR1 DNA binding domain, zinc finger, SWIM-type, MULE transposase domain containing protein [Tanacetum coccineum]
MDEETSLQMDEEYSYGRSYGRSYRTPRPTLYEQNETPGRSIYWEPHVEGIPILVEGTYYGTIDEALDMYTKYAEMAGFEVKKGGQRKTKSGAIQHKYIYCNKEGVPKDFKERFDKIVWNMFIEPLTFEEKWAQLIEDFDLKKHKWLTKMFNLREIWIPAYFIDSPLFGLMRTTSRSESENSFFKSFTSPGATLVSFMMSYESAMERQRYRQEKLDFNTIDAAPKCITQLDIERHAARVYTRTMFLIVQTEINEGCWNCTIQGLNIDEGCETVIIRDKKPNENKSLFNKKKEKKGKEEEKKTQTARDYKVLRNIEDGSVVCTCRNFLRYGFLCRHIFCVFKNREINVIPKQYILRRWTRDIIPPDLRRQKNRYGEKNVTIERLTNEANFLVDDTLFLLSKDEGKMGTYVENLKKLLDNVKADMPNPPSRDTRDVIEGIFSITKTNEIEVQNPTKAVNKGEHLKKGERLKSE